MNFLKKCFVVLASVVLITACSQTNDEQVVQERAQKLVHLLLEGNAQELPNYVFFDNTELGQEEKSALLNILVLAQQKITSDNIGQLKEIKVNSVEPVEGEDAQIVHMVLKGDQGEIEQNLKMYKVDNTFKFKFDLN